MGCSTPRMGLGVSSGMFWGFWGVPGVFLGCPRGVSGVSPGCFWGADPLDGSGGVPGVFFGCPRGVFGVSPGCFWGAAPSVGEEAGEALPQRPQALGGTLLGGGAAEFGGSEGAGGAKPRPLPPSAPLDLPGGRGSRFRGQGGLGGDGRGLGAGLAGGGRGLRPWRAGRGRGGRGLGAGLGNRRGALEAGLGGSGRGLRAGLG